MIIIKSPREIELMREAGYLLSHVFDQLAPLVRPGVSTAFLAKKAKEFIEAGGGICAEEGYEGFPGIICISLNETLIHGIPSEKRILRDGDLVSLDIVVTKNGYNADACRSYVVGIGKPEAIRLLQVTEECFWDAVSKVREGVHLGDVSHAIQAKAEANGYSVAREFTGHGIGREMHEDPYVPCYGTEGTGPILREGMTIAIEPMILSGSNRLRILGDGWQVVPRDGKLSCHYENTIVVTKDGYEVLTIDPKKGVTSA